MLGFTTAGGEIFLLTDIRLLIRRETTGWGAPGMNGLVTCRGDTYNHTLYSGRLSANKSACVLALLCTSFLVLVASIILSCSGFR